MAASSSADAPPLPPSFPLPAVHSALSPYLVPPSNVTHLRHIISTHLRSLSSGPRISSSSGTPTEFDRFLDYELSPTPSEHRAYLTALRNYSQAHSEYAAVSSSLVPEPEPEPGETDAEPTSGADDWKKDYLAVLQLRRHYARLQLLREGVNALSSAPTARSLKDVYDGPPPRDLPEELQRNRTSTTTDSLGGKNATASEQTIRELEKRILTAAEQAKRDETRLAAAKERAKSRRPPSDAAKLRALQAVQIELTHWLEEKLSIEGPANGGPDGPMSPKPRDTRATPAAIAQNIEATYNMYLTSRKELLSLLEPPPDPKPLSVDPDPEELKETLSHRLDVTPAPQRPQMLSVVEAAEKVIPLKQALKSGMATKNFFMTEIRRRELDEDEIKKRDIEAEEGDRRFHEAETTAQQQFDAAKESLEAARALVVEIETLAGAKKEKKAIPVRSTGAGKGKGVRQDIGLPDEIGLWGGLRGDVGVIGDGI